MGLAHAIKQEKVCKFIPQMVLVGILHGGFYYSFLERNSTLDPEHHLQGNLINVAGYLLV